MELHLNDELEALGSQIDACVVLASIILVV